ncbi:flagellar export protein FliJ [bacterium]|uniref:flagellar export protein FliJ n=1 Tax=Agathobacter rectalis TaxID=39491 RepID=UPI0027074074|nr:flagellar export protein FliJ [Agathobacter rectalis]MCI6044557.1 flagellar export protein FliJ [bacterium]MDO4307633.1 flagellar export protein FliJ [Eubacteriales bacterium]MDY3022547.1 flagellar export protein FliJ [Oliverpabstia sp.]MDY3999599.1 flagellar export protein FliJ [Blautia sp.]MCB6950231.1 flagellar export protein FliJ [Agathobacter rectalis]
MAGRRKKQENLTLEQQLEAVTNEIAECEAHLKELKEKKKTLNSQIEEKLKEELYRKVMKSGKNLDDVLAALSE